MMIKIIGCFILNAKMPILCVDLSITFSAYLQHKCLKLKHDYVIITYNMLCRRKGTEKNL